MTEHKRILYRGVSMIEGGPEKIQAAQLIMSYTPNGKTRASIFDKARETTFRTLPSILEAIRAEARKVIHG